MNLSHSYNHHLDMSDLDTLMDSVTTPEMEIAERNTVLSAMEPPMSKSSRIRQFLTKHPGKANREVAAELQKFGVTPADVAGVKTQLKRKAEKTQAKAAKSKPAAPSPAAAPVKAVPARSTGTSEISIDHAIGLDVLEAGIEFVRKAGGINEAQYTLTMIRRIKSL